MGKLRVGDIVDWKSTHRDNSTGFWPAKVVSIDPFVMRGNKGQSSRGWEDDADDPDLYVVRRPNSFKERLKKWKECIKEVNK